MKKKFNNFMLRIGLASDSIIRSWSSGEVISPETVNYKTGKPIFGGLFCEKIFGPSKDNECFCGKYKRIKYKGKICERCEVMVTDRIVRRRRMGHIELDDPIVHIWYFKSIPSKLSSFLNLSLIDLEKIVYYKAYTIIENDNNPNLTPGMILPLNIKISNLVENDSEYQFLTEILHHIIKNHPSDSDAYVYATEYLDAIEAREDAFLMEEFVEFVNTYGGNLELQTGGLAIEKLLKRVNIDAEISQIKTKLAAQKEKGKSYVKKLLRRLEILNNFKQTGQKPEWMVTRTIPVLPPELRPIVSLEGGRFAASGINGLYTELLIRRNRLNKIREKGAPLFMINELLNFVQEAVDNLFDNSLSVRTRTRSGKANANIVKSIATNLKGKTGRFRQNLLGKRVDYSGGSVIAGGPQLKLNQCGLPRDIAIVLFSGIIIARLLELEKAINKKEAEEMISERKPIVWDILEKIVKNYPVILNRAPTLHRLGIQAFFPKLVRGQAIMLHPLVTTPFNADFDGDRMPIHLPLTEHAKEEAKTMLLSTQNILNPRNGKLIVMPTQDIILGLYYLTFEKKDGKSEGEIFPDFQTVLLAYWNKKIDLYSLIFVPAQLFNKPNIDHTQDGLIITTAGKIIFNKVFPKDFVYLQGKKWKETVTIYPWDVDRKKLLADYQVKWPIPKLELSAIINEFLEQFDFAKTVDLLDDLKDLGFKYSTVSGMTISLFDMLEHKTDKQRFFAETEKVLDKIHRFRDLGALTEEEFKGERIKKWTRVKEKVEAQLRIYFDELRLDQSIRFMVNSGARSSISNFTQFVGMRGLMINTRGQVIDTPIKSSLAEGLTVLEYYISTYGARKGMVDTALKTADSGYLTRRLVDAMHDVYTVIDDCKTTDSLLLTPIYGKLETEILSLSERAYGRFVAEDVKDPSGEIFIFKNQFIGLKLAKKIAEYNLKELRVRSILTCAVDRGVCCYCYGLDLAKNKIIEKRQAVGVLAAQSIGEPATQLTMRTFHTGGVSDASDITQGLPRVIELFDVTTPKGHEARIAKFDGTITKVERQDDWSYLLEITPKTRVGQKITLLHIEADENIMVKMGDVITKGDQLTEGFVDLKKLLKVSRNHKKVAAYITQEVQKVYCLQGIDLDDKYIEIVISKMLSRSQIIDPGDSQYVVGQELETYVLKSVNEKLAEAGKKIISYQSIICGIKEVATKTYSFLSAASFQETTRVLIQAAIENRVDPLYGLKENVIVGNLIPVGHNFNDDFDQSSEIDSSETDD